MRLPVPAPASPPTLHCSLDQLKHKLRRIFLGHAGDGVAYVAVLDLSRWARKHSLFSCRRPTHVWQPR